jgi:hypothetical protein
MSGRGGIRTPETGVARLTVFKTAAFNRSATLPRSSDATRSPGRRDCPAVVGTPRHERSPASPLGAEHQPLNLARESPGEVAEWLKALAC